jgi:HPt (histidine-containing phosphotransfer) domain-containing protein
MVETLAADAAAPIAPPPELAGRAAFLEGLGNDTSLAKRLIDLFVQDSTRLVDDINRAIVDRDADRLRRAAHTLKGSVSNFPAVTARETAARMETIGFAADFESAQAVFPELEKEIERLRGVLPTLI